MSSFSFGDEMPYNELLAKNNSFMLQNESFKAFKAQDVEKGHFDVTFEIEGKILHANKFILTTRSERFNAWLSDRWTTKDKSVKIEDASYDNFYQFLCFIYSGFCKINRGNAFQFTDMAESYGVTCLKNVCDEALSKMKKSIETIEEMAEHATLYKLPKLMESIKNYASCPEGDDIYREEKFLAFKKPFVQFLSTLPRDPDYLIREQCRNRRDKHEIPKYRKESEFFETVYKWAEQQTLKKAPMNDDDFDVQEAIKSELTDILPFFTFFNMNYEFLMNFVVEKGFSLSAAEFGKFFVKYRDAKRHVNEDILFKPIYELVEKQVLKQQLKTPIDNFNLVDAIRAALVETIPHVRLCQMSEEFLMDFVVEKCGFTFSSTELSQFYQNSYGAEDKLFKRIYRLAEEQALQKQEMSSDPDNFNLSDSIKADLVEVIPHVKFYKMEKEFLLDFVVKKCGFTFSSTELSQFYQGLHEIPVYGKKTVIDEENCFERVYRLAEKQALEKQKKDPVDNFNLSDSSKADLVEVIPQVKFYEMDKSFLIDFVFKNGFILSPTDLSKFHQYCTGNESERFKLVYELAEKQAQQKQKISSDPDNFYLSECIKADMAKIIPDVDFYKMDKQFLMDFVLENGFFLSPNNLSNFYPECKDQSERFKLIYELAEKQAIYKQKMSSDPDNFNLVHSIHADMAKVILQVNFWRMDQNFLMDFFLENGFILSPTDLLKFHQYCDGNESERFEKVYELAEKQALQKQKMSSDPENFDVADCINTDLVEIIPKIKFYMMDKSFLNDFVVAKEILTEEQANHVYDIHFEVENNGHRIRGTLEDNADICLIVVGYRLCKVPRRNIKTAKRRFTEFKLPVPSTPSSVQKMVGCEWYLCFEKDKVLTLKHHSLVKRSDYLIAEMKGDTDFELDPDGLTTLTAKCNNI